MSEVTVVGVQEEGGHNVYCCAGGSSSASAAASGEVGESSAAIGVQAGMYSQADDGNAAEAAVAFKVFHCQSFLMSF